MKTPSSVAAKSIENKRETTISLASLATAAVSNVGTGLLIIASFLIGVLWTEVRYLKKTGGVAPTYAPTAQQAPQQQNQPQEAPLTDDQWKQVTSGAVFELGKKDAPVTLVEFTDYQCPFCGRHYTETYGKLVENYVKAGKLRILVRDLPLSFHPNARPGAIAARCAGEQGKYGQMHDALFGSQSDWTNLTGDAVKAKFGEYAKKIGLNEGKFGGCVAAEKYGKDVDADAALANKVGATGTPTFFVNKERIVGALPYTEFTTKIDAMLKR